LVLGTYLVGQDLKILACGSAEHTRYGIDNL